MGDLGNICADKFGKSEFSLKDDMLSIIGPHSVIGSCLVVHSDPDDLGRGLKC